MTHTAHSATSPAVPDDVGLPVPYEFGGPPVAGNVTAVGLVGRDEQLRELAGLLVPHRDDGAAIVLTGEPGIGKSTLLEAARTTAVAAGFRALLTVGVEAETKLPYSGLHQLLRPLLHALDGLPAPQRSALHAAFGAVDGGEPEPFLVGLATLTVLADAAAEQPVALLVDDASGSTSRVTTRWRSWPAASPWTRSCWSA